MCYLGSAATLPINGNPPYHPLQSSSQAGPCPATVHHPCEGHPLQTSHQPCPLLWPQLSHQWATTLATRGLTYWKIKLLGCCQIQVYQTYLCDMPHRCADFTRQMVDVPWSTTFDHAHPFFLEGTTPLYISSLSLYYNNFPTGQSTIAEDGNLYFGNIWHLTIMHMDYISLVTST